MNGRPPFPSSSLLFACAVAPPSNPQRTHIRRQCSTHWGWLTPQPSFNFARRSSLCIVFNYYDSLQNKLRQRHCLLLATSKETFTVRYVLSPLKGYKLSTSKQFSLIHVKYMMQLGSVTKYWISFILLTVRAI